MRWLDGGPPRGVKGREGSTMVRLPGRARGSAYPPERGASALEFALVLPLLLSALFAVVEFSRLYMADQDVVTASREGARFALGGSRYIDCAGIRAAATRLATRSRVTSVDITVRYDHGPGTATFATCPVATSSIVSGDRVVVTVSRTVTPILPGFSPTTVTATERRTITKRTGT
jgi:Flp pilus assembly protein TadG